MKPVVFGRSVQGASHIRTETECQDSCRQLECADGTVILAVADGHGSKACPYSGTGSGCAVNAFCTILSEYAEKYAGQPELLISFLNREGDTKVAQTIEAEWKRMIREVHRENNRDIPVDARGNPLLQQLYLQYGTTLLGLMLTETFLFAFQIGDGDIVFISEEGTEAVIRGDKLLGVETHSLSSPNAWKKAITVVRRLEDVQRLPAMFLMSTDGFANSYKNDAEFAKTCRDYFETVNRYGVRAVGDNLTDWLSETSELGCGDDITVLMAYYAADSGEALAKQPPENAARPGSEPRRKQRRRKRQRRASSVRAGLRRKLRRKSRHRKLMAAARLRKKRRRRKR